jgi:hypothetical protein
MRNTHRLATISIVVVAVGALVAGTAVAQTPTSYSSGNAFAEALTIKIAGNTIVGSHADADVVTGTAAKASTGQLLTPAFTLEGAKAETTTADGKQVTSGGTGCNQDLAALPGVARLDVTCGSALARLAAGGGHARGLGAELLLEPSVAEALATLQLQAPAQQVTTGLLEALNPLVQGLTGTPVGQLVSDADKTVGDVLNKILTLQATARIAVAPALAEVTSNAGDVVASARAQGLRIELLPVGSGGATNGLLPEDLKVGEPLVTITVGEAEARATASGGKETLEPRAALVTVHFGSSALADALGLPKNDITVEGGQSFCVPGLAGTPLETCVAVASAEASAHRASADGVTIDLFKGVNGGVHVTTGRVTSTLKPAAGAPAVAAPAEPDLPRTGGTATLPVVGGALLALAAVSRRLAFGRR